LRRNRPGPGAGRGTSDRLFVDSSAWIALLSARDRHHGEADAMFRRAAAQRPDERPVVLVRDLPGAVVELELLERGERPVALLDEREPVLRLGRGCVEPVVPRREASPLTVVEFATAEHHRAARLWLERLRGRPVNYTDAVSFAVMEATRCAAAMSFDRDFARAGFRLYRGRLPEPSAAVAAARPSRPHTH